MTTDADAIRYRLDDPHALCDDLGLLAGRRGKDWNTQSGRGVTVRCLWHDERTPSLSVSLGPDSTIRAKCFGCGATGNVFDLVAASQGWDKRSRFRDVLDVAADLARLPRPERHDSAERPSFVRVAERPEVPPEEENPRDEAATAQVAALLSHLAPVTASAEGMAYLRSRGLDESEGALGWYVLPTGAARDRIVEACIEEMGRDAWMRSGLSSRGGWWAGSWGGPRLVIPWRDPHGNVTTLQGRLIGEARDDVQKFAFAWGQGPRWPYGCNALKANDRRTVVVTEGAIDAESFNVLARRDRANAVAVALSSVSSVAAWEPAWFRLFAGRRCACGLDNDDAGKKHTPELFAKLSAVAEPDGVGVLVPKGAKDWNAVLCARLAAPVSAVAPLDAARAA